MVLEEICLFRGRRLEVRLDTDLSYRLSYAGEVTYADGVREVRGKKSRYAFRSVEQLRYDFEQDVKAIGGDLG